VAAAQVRTLPARTASWSPRRRPAGRCPRAGPLPAGAARRRRGLDRSAASRCSGRVRRDVPGDGREGRDAAGRQLAGGRSAAGAEGARRAPRRYGAGAARVPPGACCGTTLCAVRRSRRPAASNRVSSSMSPAPASAPPRPGSCASDPRRRAGPRSARAALGRAGTRPPKPRGQACIASSAAHGTGVTARCGPGQPLPQSAYRRR